MLHDSERPQGRDNSRIARQESGEGIRCSSQGCIGRALDRPYALQAICLTNPAGFHPRHNQPTNESTNPPHPNNRLLRHRMVQREGGNPAPHLRPQLLTNKQP